MRTEDRTPRGNSHRHRETGWRRLIPRRPRQGRQAEHPLTCFQCLGDMRALVYVGDPTWKERRDPGPASTPSEDPD